MHPRHPSSALFPYTTLFRSVLRRLGPAAPQPGTMATETDPDYVERYQAYYHRLLPLLSVLPRLEPRSEEHTSELQSHVNLVCRLLLEKKKTITVEVTAPIAI